MDASLDPVEVAKPRALAPGLRLGAGPEPSLEARTALWLTGVAVIVLLIACANVANLFLVRALERERETAVRLALGASRNRLVMRTLSESLVLSCAGSVVGLVVATWGGTAISRLLITGVGGSLDVLTDWRTLGIATVIALGTGILTGLGPALLAGRGDLVRALKTGAREGTYHRSGARTTLLVVQSALSVVLLVGAGLFVQSLQNVKAMRMGYDAERVLLASINLRGTSLDEDGRVRLGETLLGAAQAIPGVTHASWAMTVPLSRTNVTSIFVPGIDSVRRLGQFTYQAATADYFRAMGTRIVRGRGFTQDDRTGTQRIIVVSEGMAKAVWPGRDALGQCVRVFADTMPCATVVGVAEDMVQEELTSAKQLHYYLPISQFFRGGGAAVLIRTRDDPARQAETVRAALQAVMPGESYVRVRPFGELVDSTRRSWQLGATMSTVFAGLALVVAAVGLYGVIGYNVAHRRQELGVRVALGARWSDIVQIVVGQGVRYALLGVAVGVALALGASHWLEPLLFRQSATDPRIYGLVGVMLVLVALAASAPPGVRAARADLNAALRGD